MGTLSGGGVEIKLQKKNIVDRVKKFTNISPMKDMFGEDKL